MSVAPAASCFHDVSALLFQYSRVAKYGNAVTAQDAVVSEPDDVARMPRRRRSAKMAMKRGIVRLCNQL